MFCRSGNARTFFKLGDQPMTRRQIELVFGLAIVVSGLGGQSWAQDESSVDRKSDVIYGRKFGTALTMDVFTPKANANGLGIIWVVSGGWFSSHESIGVPFIEELTKRGYTVFAVVHGSQPKFTIPEVVEDMNRAVRFIRYHAKDYHIDPDHIGITGGSAGGHLSLMIGLAGSKSAKDPKDEIDKVSSRVQAVGCFFPPTDFFNYGKPGEVAGFKAPFDFHELDPARKYFVPVSDLGKTLEIGRQISPITHATSDDPPTLIIHGDADKLVPIQQAEVVLDKLKAAGVETKLVVRKGEAHGWKDWHKDMAIIADWFDAHLKSSH
jgi:acetyl esterase/lipase